MLTSVGLIACPDQPGLVHKITGVLLGHNLNVTENQEFVDHQTKRFFMRTQFDGETEMSALTRDLKKVIPVDSFCQVRPLQPRKIVAFASSEPHCLGDLLLKHFTGELAAQILAVISQTADCQHLTEKFGLPFHHVPVQGRSRADHETAVLQVLQNYSAEYLVLARYMRVLTPEFIQHFPNRIINIHHSFLPAFIGRDPYNQAYQRGVKIIGATAHIVTDLLDEGPIVTQDVVAVDHTSSPEVMAKRGQDVEKIVLSRGLDLILKDRVLVDGTRTIIFE